MMVFSNTTGKSYEESDAVFYRNLVQGAWLLNKPDAVLLDIFTDGLGKIVLVFPKSLHKKYIQEWAERSRENKKEENELDRQGKVLVYG